MRPIIKTTLCAIIAVAMAAPAVAAADYYLKFDSIKGESTAKASGGKQIEIESWSWGATQAARVNLNSSKSNANREIAVSDPGAAGSKRQHGWVTVSKPLDRGAVRVKVKFPWLACRVGAAYPDAVLQNAAGRYELKEVVISGCAPDGVALNYAKVQVRGWDRRGKRGHRPHGAATGRRCSCRNPNGRRDRRA